MTKRDQLWWAKIAGCLTAWLLALLVMLFFAVNSHALSISFVASAGNSASPNGTFNITIPAACDAGDFLVVGFAVGDTAGADNNLAVNGFTEISDQVNTADTQDIELFTGYRFMLGTDTQIPISGNFTALGGTNASNAAVMMCFRNVKSVADGGPFDTAATPQVGQDTTNADPPSHNWSGAAGVWTVIVGAGAHTGGVTATYTAPANYTTDAVTRNHDDSNDVIIGMGYRTNPADPEDPAVWTGANIGTAANNSWAAVTISLAPAPDPPPAGGGVSRRKLRQFLED